MSTGPAPMELQIGNTKIQFSEAHVRREQKQVEEILRRISAIWQKQRKEIGET